VTGKMDQNAKVGIPVHEITLTNGNIVVFYNYLTTGEFKQLQKLLLESGKFNTATSQIADIPLSVFMDYQDKAATFLIKEVKINEIPDQSFSMTWLDNLPRTIGDEVYKEVQNLTGVSTLSQDEKKV
jgi:hypothetical protein